MIDNNDNNNLYNSGNSNGSIENQPYQNEEKTTDTQQSSAYVVNDNQSNDSGSYQEGTQYGQSNQGYQSYPNNGGFNSMSYDPKPPKNQKNKKVLGVAITVLCVAAIAATGIVGINFVTKGMVGSSSDSSQSESTGSDSSDSSEAEATTTRDTSDLPSIYQLSAPDDALTIPEIVEKCKDSIVGISCIFSTGTGSGTGIIMSEDGYIITNAHVVNGATSVSVVFTDNPDEGIDAEIIGIDSQTDIAVIKIDKTGLTAAEFGKSSELQVGEAAIVIGNPLGFELAGSVTSGIISAVDRELTVNDKTLTLIQTDASINSGNSGGALFNAYGQVVGITSAKINSQYGEGLGFAIPIDEATPVIEDLIQYGYVTGRPSLGLSGRDVSAFYSEYYGMPQGFMVESVEEGSAAEKAGIKQGDIIVGIDGTLITSMDEFNEIKETHQAGDTVTISLYRDGERMDVEATLDEDTSSATDQETTTEATSSSQGGYSWRMG